MVVVQSVSPQINFVSYKTGNVYQEFSISSRDISGMNLQSYQFQKSINTLGGVFSITIKEQTNNTVLGTEKPFIDKVHTLDIVNIRENDLSSIDFVGVVTEISYQASESSKLITINGRSIDYLLDFFTIALDASAMAWSNQQISVDARNLEYKSTNGGDGPAKIKDVVKKSYDFFCEVATGLNKLSNVKVKELIDSYMIGGTSLLEGGSDLEFKYPISSNILQDSTVNWIEYIRNLLPEAVYEMYSTVTNGLTKLRIRQVPYSSNEWKKLPCTKIDDYEVISYSLKKSIEEVYTNFYSYVEGSSLSPEFWNHLNATTEGNTKSVTLEEKVKLYGYKPLQCNFIGYNTESESDITNNFIELNKLLADWYGHQDELYSGSLTIANIANKNKAKIGERISFIGGQFYVTGENHTWNYGTTAKITYQLDRGGNYSSNGQFSELKNISIALSELENVN